MPKEILPGDSFYRPENTPWDCTVCDRTGMTQEEAQWHSRDTTPNHPCTRKVVRNERREPIEG